MRRQTLMWTLLMLVSLGASSCIGSAEPKLKCTSNDDCLDGGAEGVSYTCDATQGLCLRSCTVATETNDCLDLQRCDVAAGQTDGVCRDGSASPGDPGPGDPGPGDPGPGD